MFNKIDRLISSFILNYFALSVPEDGYSLKKKHVRTKLDMFVFPMI
jgi:hypothetical protein